MKPLSQSEFNLTVRAKNGDASANIELWERYRPVAISILKPVRGLSFEEKISEAYMIFLHKLEIFNPDKVLSVRDPDTFTFSYMMTGALKNLKAKLAFRYKDHNNHVSFLPFDEDGDNYGANKEYPYLVIEKGGFYFVKDKMNIDALDSNNPANILLTKETEKELPKKERLFYTKISDFQKKVLEMRREGKTFKEISNILGYSLSWVRKNYYQAKDIANRVFGLRPVTA
jgi:hypothetical protein